MNVFNHFQIIIGLTLIIYFNACSQISNDLIVLKFLTEHNECPKGINCFNDYYKALDYSKRINKPIFIMFIGYACVSDRYFENNVITNPQVRKIIKENYVVVFLYVDDKKKLPIKEQITIDYLGKQKKIKTIGNKWAYFEFINFQQVSQPYFVLLSNTEELLTKPIGRVRKNEINKFINFLKCGLKQ